MPIQPDRLVGYRLPEIAQTYAPRDAILYALGVGLGHDPCAREDLKFLIEDGLEVLPTFAVTLRFSGHVDQGAGIRRRFRQSAAWGAGGVVPCAAAS